MDEMKISSKFMTGMIAKILKKMILKQTGYDIDIWIGGISASIMDGRTHMHIDMDAELSNDDLAKMIKM